MTTIVRSSAKCRTCQAPIGFIRTEHGKVMPVDPTPTAAGNVAVHKDVHGTLVGRVISEELPAAPWETVYMPHFATCGPTHLFDPPPGSNVIPLPTRKRRSPRAYHHPDH